MNGMKKQFRKISSKNSKKQKKNQSKIAACEQISSKKTKINVKIPHASKKNTSEKTCQFFQSSPDISHSTPTHRGVTSKESLD